MLEKKKLKLSDTPYTKHATVYLDTNVRPKACILYFHGGGLLYGQRNDLPELHLRKLTEAGFAVTAFDYPLAPAAKLDIILEDVCASINHYNQSPEQYTGLSLPYFLWGRSAGAYLCLLAAAKGELYQNPLGILSYYGYGFLCDNWFNTPSPYYSTLPAVDNSCMRAAATKLTANGQLSTHYSIYVYARQTGTWRDLIYDGRDKHFYLHYTLRTTEHLPAPLFCAHSTGDTDVPYAEFLELTTRFNARRFIVPGDTHDFDRDEGSAYTESLLKETLEFLNKNFIG